MSQRFLCSEPTADNKHYFFVDSIDTFYKIADFEMLVVNEADHWGDFKFDVGNKKKEKFLKKVAHLPTITMDMVEKARAPMEADPLYSEEIEDAGMDDYLGDYQKLIHENSFTRW